MIFFEHRRCSRKGLKTNHKSIKMTPRLVTKQPKILPRRLQDGLEEVFFSHCFLSSIFIRFGVDFGAIRDPFWEPKSVMFGIYFLMVFACGSKIVPRAAKSGPRAAKSLPRASQERPRAAQERPREPQERQKVTQEGPRAAKTDPRGAQEVRKENEKDNEKITRAVQAK